MKWEGVIKHYRRFLPIPEDAEIITLKEGGTPLIFAKHISKELGLNIYLKYEGQNPTGSFKDRGMTVAVTGAVREGARTIICASTGNTAASAAAYGAAAGLCVIVVIPKGKVALGKLSQALIHGAKIVELDANFDEALRIVQRICEKYPVKLVNSTNPLRIEGQKTAAFEVCDELGTSPHYHALPVGNAGNITSYWKGYKEYKKEGFIKTLPKMLGFQAEGAAPIVRGKIIKRPRTIATAIRIGNPASWKQALAARDESGGLIEAVTDEEIIEAYKIVAQLEGLFAEPASCASIAGIIKLNKRGYFQKGAIVVCTLTGHGLKDPKIAQSVLKISPIKAKSFEDVVSIIKG